MKKRGVVCKICGILNQADENESPLVYMSPGSAKKILQAGENISEEISLWIKIKHAGEMQQVQEDLDRLGITADNIDKEVIRTWKMQSSKMVCFCLTAIISGLAAWLLFFERLRIDALRNKEEYEILQSMVCFQEKEQCESPQNIESPREKEECKSQQNIYSFRENFRKRMNCCRSFWFGVTGFGIGIFIFTFLS